ARDREDFERTFGCPPVENSGSSEGVVTILRQPGTPPDALGLPPPGPGVDVAVVEPRTGEECPRARFDEHGRLVNGDHAIGEIVNRAGAGSFRATTTTRRRTGPGCATAGTGRATWPTGTRTGGSTSRGAPRTGCASTASTSPPP